MGKYGKESASKAPGDWEWFDFRPLWAAKNIGYTHVIEEIDAKLLAETFEKIFSTLTEREVLVLKARFWDRSTLKEIGKEYGVTGNRIREIESKAIRKLRHESRSNLLLPFFSDKEKYLRRIGRENLEATQEYARRYQKYHEHSEWLRKQKEHHQAEKHRLYLEEKRKELDELAYREELKRQFQIQEDFLKQLSKEERDYINIKMMVRKFGYDNSNYEKGTCPPFVKLVVSDMDVPPEKSFCYLKVDEEIGQIYRRNDPETYDRWLNELLERKNNGKA